MTDIKVPYFVPWITDEDKKEVMNALSSRWLTNGEKVREFERKFAEYIGVKYAIAVNSCTAALHTVMLALKIKEGDEVIAPTFTFAATANAVIYCGGRPVFVDIDEKTYNISVADVERKITDKTKAIVAVHYGGQPCDIRELREIARDRKLYLVEDSAHALGAEYSGEMVGGFGVAGCFSFYPTKIITTLEGGMITTNDDEIARRARLIREHGISKTSFDREKEMRWDYDIVSLGFNYRMNEIEAALGISQLKRVEKANDARRRIAQVYDDLLKTIDGIVVPERKNDRSNVYHLYPIRCTDEFGARRNDLFKYLALYGIGTAVNYTPLHLMTFYRELLKYKKGDFPVAERVSEEILSLPIYPTMSLEQVAYVVSKICEIGEVQWRK